MTTKTHRDPDATERVDVVKRFYGYLKAGDVPAVLGLLDPEVKWTEAKGFPYYSGTWTGPDAVLNNLLKRLAADWSDFAATPDNYLVEGSKVVSFGHYSGTYKKTGKSMRAAFAHLWTVDDGKIANFLMFTDTAKVLEALTP